MGRSHIPYTHKLIQAAYPPRSRSSRRTSPFSLPNVSLKSPRRPVPRPPHAPARLPIAATHTGRIYKYNSPLATQSDASVMPGLPDRTQRLYMCTLDRLRGAAPGVKPETGKRNSHNGGEDDPRSAPLLSPPHRYHIAQCARVDASHTHEDTSRAAGEALILSRCHASMASC